MLIYTTGRFITDMPCPGLYCGESHGPCLCPCPCPDCGGKKRMSVCGPYTSKHIQASTSNRPLDQQPIPLHKAGCIDTWTPSVVAAAALAAAAALPPPGRSVAVVRPVPAAECRLVSCVVTVAIVDGGNPNIMAVNCITAFLCHGGIKSTVLTAKLCGCNHARVRDIPVSLPVSCRVRVPTALPVTVTVTVPVGGPR
jgi:hypothetical protein